MALVSGVKAEDAARALRSFKGVEHRVEFVREVDGVRYIDDSEGTNADSTVKAVETMKAPTVIILGGCGQEKRLHRAGVRPLRTARISRTPC